MLGIEDAFELINHLKGSLSLSTRDRVTHVRKNRQAHRRSRQSPEAL